MPPHPPEVTVTTLLDYEVVDGRPVNPYAPLPADTDTGLHPGENRAADYAIFASQCLLLVQRRDGSWALPGGRIDPGETPDEAARREAGEETGLALTDEQHSRAMAWPARYVPDPRNRIDGWMVTVVHVLDLGPVPPPPVAGLDGVLDAGWFRATSLDDLVADVARRGGRIWQAHVPVMADLLHW